MSSDSTWARIAPDWKRSPSPARDRYYNADSTAELSEALGTIANELEVVAAAPKKAVSNRRAIKVLKPAVDFPEYAEIRVITHGLGSISIVATGKYGDEIRLPSGTEKYEIQWLPKAGEPVAIVKDFTLPERKVVEL